MIETDPRCSGLSLRTASPSRLRRCPLPELAPDSMLRDAAMVVGKDLRLEWRSRVTLSQILPFALLVLILFAFALDPDRRILEEATPGLFWLAVLFSMLGSGEIALTQRLAWFLAAAAVAPGVILVQLLIQNGLAVTFPSWVTTGPARGGDRSDRAHAFPCAVNSQDARGGGCAWSDACRTRGNPGT